MSDVGVIVRTRAGKNIFIQTRGLEQKHVLQAGTEAMGLLDAAVALQDATDVVSPLQGLPLTCGSLNVLEGRYSVVYRVVNQVLVLVVAYNYVSVFTSLALLSKVVQTLIAESKSLELTPERIDKAFAEVYIAVSLVISTQGVVNAESAVSDSHVLAQAGHKEQSKTPQPPVIYQNQHRTLNGQAQQLAGLSFSTNSAFSKLKPLPGFEAPQPESTTTRQAPPPSYAFNAPASAPSHRHSSQLSDDPFASFGDVSLLPVTPAADSAAPKTSSQPASDDPFSAFVVEARPAAVSTAAAAPAAESDSWTAFDAGAVVAAPAGPVGPQLRLREVWRAEVEGSFVTRARLTGTVEWSDGAAKLALQPVGFRLQVPDYATTSDVHNALINSHRHPAAVQPGPTLGTFLADPVAARPLASCCLLRYSLPPASCSMPLQVQIGASLQLLHDGQLLVQVGLSIALDPAPGLHFGDLSIELSLPSLVGLPVRVEPQGQFDGGRRKLQWVLTGLYPGKCHTLSAFFVVSASQELVEKQLGNAQAEIRLEGGAGESLTGIKLAQGIQSLESSSAAVDWVAHVSARLRKQLHIPLDM